MKHNSTGYTMPLFAKTLKEQFYSISAIYTTNDKRESMRELTERCLVFSDNVSRRVIFLVGFFTEKCGEKKALFLCNALLNRLSIKPRTFITREEFLELIIRVTHKNIAKSFIRIDLPCGGHTQRKNR